MKESLYSVFFFKCPRCHQGDFFESNNPYNLKRAGEVKDSCSQCGLKYSPEPGFYYGGMYVSYAFGIALFVTVWLSLSIFHPDYPPLLLITLLFTSLLLLGPYIYALSKIIWANMFMHYDEKIALNLKTNKDDTK